MNQPSAHSFETENETTTSRPNLFGLSFDPLTVEATKTAILDREKSRDFAYLVTPNVDHVVRLARAPLDVRTAYAGAWICVNDSRVLQRLAGFLGLALPVAPGSDLVVSLLGDPALPRDTPMIIVGGDEDLVARVRERCNLTKLIHHQPPMGLRRNKEAMAEAVEAVVSSEARLVFLAVGSPQQELLAAAIARDPRARGTALCIGAGLEFLAGVKRRAPRLMQKLSLEWAFRLAAEPRRLWRRYLVDGLSILPLFLDELRRRRVQ